MVRLNPFAAPNTDMVTGSQPAHVAHAGDRGSRNWRVDLLVAATVLATALGVTVATVALWPERLQPEQVIPTEATADGPAGPSHTQTPEIPTIPTSTSITSTTVPATVIATPGAADTVPPTATTRVAPQQVAPQPAPASESSQTAQLSSITRPLLVETLPPLPPDSPATTATASTLTTAGPAESTTGSDGSPATPQGDGTTGEADGANGAQADATDSVTASTSGEAVSSAE